MSKLLVFQNVSLDGYFTDANGDMSFAHQAKPDAEWDDFVANNARGGGLLLFGRVTYDMMASFWPTQQAAKAMPTVAQFMNELPKVVFSRTLKRASWQNTTVRSGDPAREVQQLKQESNLDMALMGSGSIVSCLTDAGLIDEFQLVVHPVVLGAGRTAFEGVRQPVQLKLSNTRRFNNGCVVLNYTRHE